MSDLVILVGGRGTRLGRITANIPKPLIKIKNKNFLDILLSKLIKFNFKTIYLLCSYKKKQFFKDYNNKKIHNSKIVCIDEGDQKGTGGGLFKLKKRIKKNFFLLNGDSYLDINLNLLKEKLGKKDIGVISLILNNTYKENNIMNNLDLTKKNIVKYNRLKSNYMNGGVYYFSKKIFKYIQNKKTSLENEILDNFIKKNKIKGIKFSSKFIDIGTLKNLRFIKKNFGYLQQKAVFLDRDGVINKLKKNGYIKTFSEFKFLPGVIDGVKFLNDNNYQVIIITNQACIGKSIITEKQLNKIHLKMKRVFLLKKRAQIDDIFYSPYFKYSKIKKYRQNFYDRKPNPGMILKAKEKWNIDLKKSFLIGDRISDLETARKLKLKFYYKNKGSLLNQLKKIILKKKH